MLQQEWKRYLGQEFPRLWLQAVEISALVPQVDGLYAVYDGFNSSW
jgi:hypothetical protein